MDFKNTVIITTANVGSRHLLAGVTGDAIPDGVRESVRADVRRAFRPELSNRIDEVLLLKRLTREEITVIVDLLLAEEQGAGLPEALPARYDAREPLLRRREPDRRDRVLMLA